MIFNNKKNLRDQMEINHKAIQLLNNFFAPVKEGAFGLFSLYEEIPFMWSIYTDMENLCDKMDLIREVIKKIMNIDIYTEEGIAKLTKRTNQ
jgi:hypothetical protein